MNIKSMLASDILMNTEAGIITIADAKAEFTRRSGNGPKAYKRAMKNLAKVDGLSVSISDLEDQGLIEPEDLERDPVAEDAAIIKRMLEDRYTWGVIYATLDWAPQRLADARAYLDMPAKVSSITSAKSAAKRKMKERAHLANPTTLGGMVMASRFNRTQSIG